MIHDVHQKGREPVRQPGVARLALDSSLAVRVQRRSIFTSPRKVPNARPSLVLDSFIWPPGPSWNICNCFRCGAMASLALQRCFKLAVLYLACRTPYPQTLHSHLNPALYRLGRRRISKVGCFGLQDQMTPKSKGPVPSCYES